ncbi:hypothetical protein [Ensifer canadensis]
MSVGILRVATKAFLAGMDRYRNPMRIALRFAPQQISPVDQVDIFIDPGDGQRLYGTRPEELEGICGGCRFAAAPVPESFGL